MSNARLPNSIGFSPATNIRSDGINRNGPNSKISLSSIVCTAGNLGLRGFPAD
jgi:hypothetical protein